jgi:hypothetical protein
LIEVLPAELRPPLERGKQRSGGRAQRMARGDQEALL